MTFRLSLQVEPEVVSERTDRLDEHDADFTPQGTALLCHYAARDLLFDRRQPATFIDPTAGGGIYGWAARKVFPGIHSVGNDLRGEESDDLTANYDQTFNVDFRDLAGRTGRCDLGMTNVPFSVAADVWEASDGLVTRGGGFAMLVRITLGDAAEDCRKLWGSSVERRGRSGFFYLEDEERYAELRRPDVVIDFSNRIKFRHGINPDSGKAWGSDSTTYRIMCRRVGVERRPRMQPMAYYKLDRMDDRLFRWIETAEGRAIRPGEEWRVGDEQAEVEIIELARKSWRAQWGEK